MAGREHYNEPLRGVVARSLLPDEGQVPGTTSASEAGIVEVAVLFASRELRDCHERDRAP